MTVPVLEEVIGEYKRLGMKFDYLCCIYPTAPFITGNMLKQAKKILIQKKAQAVVPVTRFSYPIQRALKIENGFAKMFWPRNYNKRSQDLEPAYHDCGLFYFMRTYDLLKQKKLFPKLTVPFEIPESEVQDIDNIEDWVNAELKYRILKAKKESKKV